MTLKAGAHHVVLVLLGVPSFSDLFRAGCKHSLPPMAIQPTATLFNTVPYRAIAVQSLVDISSDAGWLDTALAAMTLVQSLMQVGSACAAVCVGAF